MNQQYCCYNIVVNIIVVYTIVSIPLLCYMAKQKKKNTVQSKHENKISKLGARIKSLRIKQGYVSAEKFALEHDLSRVQMGRWEQGKNIRIETVFKLAEAFGISSSELLKDI